jgi:transcriptional regulator with XRE-family HTH domain
MQTDFVIWLTEEMNERGWSNSELARRAEIVPSTISSVISGRNQPGLELCIGVARAFNYPPERVLRQAGLLPDQGGNQVIYNKLIEVAKNLEQTELENSYQYLLWRYQVQQQKKQKPPTAEDQ